VKPAKQAAPEVSDWYVFRSGKAEGRLANCKSGKFRKLPIAQKLDGENLTGNPLVKFQNWQSILLNISVSQIILNRPGVYSFDRQIVPAAVPKHILKTPSLKF
jgi:hypothetical protein